MRILLDKLDKIIKLNVKYEKLKQNIGSMEISMQLATIRLEESQSKVILDLPDTI